VDSVILIFGKRGSGKSTLAKKILSHSSRVVIFDPLSEYRDEAMIYTTWETFYSSMQRHRNDATFRLVCRFEYEDEDETREAYQSAARACYVVKNVLLVLEECELFLQSGEHDNYINHLTSFGRHRNVCMLAIGRRPPEIPIKLRANTTTTISFRQVEPRDLQYLESWGFNPDELEKLPDYHFAYAEGSNELPYLEDYSTNEPPDTETGNAPELGDVDD
jgi:energy-coupling factor transporter ATP-binding protein EcfA2